MTARRIVPIEPASGSGETVVVQVQQQGDHPLDVRLVGCEGENPYIATLQHHNLGKLKHKYKGTDEEWANILSYFLLQRQPDQGHDAILDGVRIVYTIKKASLELSIRQDVQSIKVVLGEIVLKRDDEFEFNPFEWAQLSATAHQQTLAEMAELRARIRKEQEIIEKLNSQLNDFIKTKNEAETVMLQQFMQLLNEKKRKIRDQNRLLASVKIEEDTANNVKATRAGKSHTAGSSRLSKRKAPAQTSESAPDSDSDQMDVDQAKIEEQEDDEVPAVTTPDHSDVETDTEGEEPALDIRRSRSSRTASAAPDASKDIEESIGVPPPRSLPFGKPATRSGMAAKKPSPPSTNDEDDDDDQTDDEEL